MKINRLGPRAIGLPWYKEEDYFRLRALFDDGHKLHGTWTEWKEAAEQIRKRYDDLGVIVIKTYLDPDTFPDWCAENGHDIDAQGRMVFANQEAARVMREAGRLASEIVGSQR